MTPPPPAPPAGFRHETVTREGVRVHVVVGGSGPPLVLVHGFLGTWHAWRKVMPRLAERYTVLAPDMRGYGDSDKPAGATPGAGYDAAAVAEDVRAALRALGPGGPAHLVGHDMGGPPLLYLALAHPGQARSLTYIDEPVPGVNDVKVSEFRPESHGGTWWFGFNAAPGYDGAAGLAETLVRGREREFLTWFYRTFYADPARLEPAAVDEVLRTFAAPGGVTGALAHYRAWFDSATHIRDAAGRGRVRVPVLGVGSAKSMGPEVAAGLRAVADDVTAHVTQAGHFPAEEDPDEFLAALLPFLSRAEARAAGA